VRSARGFTYFELLATMIILTILAAAVMPTAKVVRKRQKEIELRRALRIIRTALDEFHDAAAPAGPGQVQLIGGTDLKVGSEGYPEDLEKLVKGVNVVGKIDVKKKFLRRIPFDPMTGKQEWGKRCYQDDPDDTSWCGENVYDVYSLSGGVALDGSKYKEW
jgi:general secretion pathway protein G